MPDELWTEVRDIVQETGIKTIPKEKKCKKAKWLSEEVLQIAVKRKVKSKGEKERHTHLNAAFQRIARRDKKAFLSDQGKKIEENDRMGKTRDLFKKIRDTNRTFHAKMGSIKNRNGMDLTEAGTSLVAQRVKRLPTVRETWVRSLGQEDPLEKEMATHSSTLAWKIPWKEKCSRLQSMGLQRVGHD